MEKIEISELDIKIRPTQIKHRQQTNFQIMLPMIFVGLIMIAAAVLIILNSSNNYALSYQYANISIILLILPTFFVALLIGGIVIALCFGVIKIQEIIPKYSALADYYAKLITKKLQAVQDNALEPVLLGKIFIFRLSVFLQKIGKIIKQNSEI
jgi:uncharacterized membrane protein